jgi:PAS domain S-box-containing protein
MGTTENPRRTILLVDDEAIIAYAEAAMLKRNGYEVLTAYTGAAAIEAATSRSTVDLVLMDLDLGQGMDGTQAADAIQKRMNVPVLFLSNHTEPEIVDRTERVNSSGYVVKNSGETVLLASIRMAFKLHEARLQIQKKAEELELTNDELRRSETELRSLFQAGPAAVAMLSRRVFMKVNEMMLSTFGYTEEEMLGHMTRMLYYDDEEYERVGRELYGDVRTKGRAVAEARLKRKDGSPVDVLISAGPMYPDAEDPTAAVATTLLEITGRKRAETERIAAERVRVEEALREKDALVSELQHRTKNGLIMIASIVGLEFDRAEAPETRKVLADIRERIMTLANLYDRLIQSSGTASVDLADYLRSIVESLERAYLRGTGGVRIDQRYVSVVIDAKTSTAWGLIVNELVTNALKYAFPDGSSGSIGVELGRKGDQLELVVADDGAGLPGGFELSSHLGLGLHIVEIMVAQIQGTLSFSREGGTIFTVRAPLTAR